MLVLHLDKQSAYIEDTGKFVDIEERDICLEHSLHSMAQWESEFEKPFLLKNYQMSISESIRYLQMMIINGSLTFEEAALLFGRYGDDIRTYIARPMTATTFTKHTQQKPDRTTVTAELIYYWMFSNQIPIECERWHLNRLLTLIRVFGVKNAPKKRMSRNEAFRQQNALNAERTAARRLKG